jgi:surface polysaccharide O-acyltransferase-like enzyme
MNEDEAKSANGNEKPTLPQIPDKLIRTVAIILVVLLHASNEYYGGISQTPSESITYWWVTTIYKSIALPCVPLFIMLSGAFLLQHSKVNESIRVFLKKRLGRIGLAFAFWSAIYLIWAFYNSGIMPTFFNVIQGIGKGLITGPYYHFWFLYLIAGLYLLTPILRSIVAFKKEKILGYLVMLWFLGVAVVPLIQLITGYGLNTGVFEVGGWIGYFVLGVYFKSIRVRPWVLRGYFILGLVWTVAITWLMSYPLVSLGRSSFFMDSLAANVIVVSVALFMILCEFPLDWPGPKHPQIGKIVSALSSNTLPIYLFHVIILESLQKGYFGFTISLTTINPIIEIPLIATVTLFTTLAIVLFMKKVPILRKLIG